MTIRSASIVDILRRIGLGDTLSTMYHLHIELMSIYVFTTVQNFVVLRFCKFIHHKTDLLNCSTMISIPSATSFVLDLPPSCIAFCPSLPDYFVVGTYYLHPKQEVQHASEAAFSIEGRRSDHEGEQQKRSGSLILYRLDGDTV